ncbi:MAG: threonine synthase [Beijerinckiaceae bacterium]
MKYLSTRGEAPVLSFNEAMLAGLARDGGLYLPDSYPVLSRETIAGFAGKSYGEVAKAVLLPFVGTDLDEATLEGMIEAAYGSFRHEAIAPLAQLGDNLFVLELFHGPTLAFKDLAMQLLARFMDHALKQRGQHATIVGATSGDTGAAAIEAFRGLSNIDVVIFYPHQRVSDVQRRQMTTAEGENIHVVALEGTFDDAQAIVKSLFNHTAFRDEFGLSGVNSINWARVLAQTVYYFTSAVALGAPHRPVSYTVPTGNFGDILAGWIAKRMGLPIERLVIATNENDILVRALHGGVYETRGVQHTQSPSMDIQVSSNFERLLFELSGRDAASIRAKMASLAQSRGFTLEAPLLAALRAEFDADRTSEQETAAEIARCWDRSDMLIDPHTAVGIHAGRRRLADHPAIPMVVLGTAHAAKFPDAIEKAIGLRPPLPHHMAGLFDRPEQFTVLPNDTAAVESFIRARVGRGHAVKTA